jgi:hypothetical protein
MVEKRRPQKGETYSAVQQSDLRLLEDVLAKHEREEAEARDHLEILKDPQAYNKRKKEELRVEITKDEERELKKKEAEETERLGEELKGKSMRRKILMDYSQY